MSRVNYPTIVRVSIFGDKFHWIVTRTRHVPAVSGRRTSDRNPLLWNVMRRKPATRPASDRPDPSPGRSIDDIRAWLRGLPKAELHLHLEGTIEPETLVALSQRHDPTPLTLPDARNLYTYTNFLGFLDAFKAVSSRLCSPDDYELITYNMVRALAAQGVVHAEVYISFGII